MNNALRVSFGIKTSQANTTYRRVADTWQARPASDVA